jgi:cobalt-zinc-cadmium efflux system membrane fusion protein
MTLKQHSSSLRRALARVFGAIPRRHVRPLLIGGGVLLVAAVGWQKFQGSAEAKAEAVAQTAPAAGGNQTLYFPQGAPQLAYLKIEAAKAEAVPLLEPLNGRLAYDDNVTARISPAVSGRVTKLLVQAGDTVKSGAVLALLDSPDFAQAQADQRRAAADLRLKQAAYERANVLFEGGVLARRDHEAAVSDLEAAKAESARAAATLRHLSPSGDQYALRAPLAGVVTERQANPGTEVRPDQANALFVVSDPTRLWAIAELAEKDLGKLKVGQDLSISVEAYPGEAFPAKIEAIGDVLDAQTRRVQVRCSVANKERRLKPEMYARLLPQASGPARPRVPNTALVTEGLHTHVFVEVEPGKIEKRRVTLAFRGREESWIDTGVQPGERVITAGALLLNAELAGQ